VFTNDEDGKQVRVYKQETLFNVDDYQQVIGYHKERRHHHDKMVRGYKRRCKDRFAVELF
jgi:hypothetical protein